MRRSRLLNANNFGNLLPRAALQQLLARDGNTAANYRAGVGQTDDGAGLCSSWANQIGAAGALTAATTARPTIQADGSLLFDGVANVMVSTFTLNQPETVYFVGKIITWTANRRLYDGVINLGMTISMNNAASTGVEPNIVQHAGSLGANDLTHMTTNVYHIVSSVFNGASSSLTVDSNAANVGNAGVNNGGGLTLASDGTQAFFANLQIKEVIVRNVADSAATQALIQGYLKAIYGTP